MQWATEHGSETLRTSHSDLPKRLVVDAHERREADRRLFTRLGFQPRRWFEELLRPLTDVPPAVAVEGIPVIGWPDGRDDELLEVRNAALADHWGSNRRRRMPGRRTRFAASSRRTRSVLRRRRRRRPAGRHLRERPLRGRQRGDGAAWSLGGQRSGRSPSGAVSVSRRRSSSPPLTAFADAGFTHGALGVDGDSPTGAGRLYRSLGFEVTVARCSSSSTCDRQPTRVNVVVRAATSTAVSWTRTRRRGRPGGRRRGPGRPAPRAGRRCRGGPRRRRRRRTPRPPDRPAARPRRDR